jgi:RNA polymerase sigma-70 factor (ECF subfamily)
MATIAPTRGRAHESEHEAPAAPPAGDAADRHLLDALRRGDEAAFRALVERHHATMVRVARGFVPTRAVAEEVAQETWLGVLNGLPRFEGRSSLKTWIFSILVKRARTHGERERRTVPFSSLVQQEAESPDAAVDPDRFLGPDQRWAGHWACGPRPFTGPAERLVADETMAVLRRAVDELPPAQRTVISLRDLEGWDPSEVCALLGISDGNQRVLLHRARAKVRTALERHLDED